MQRFNLDKLRKIVYDDGSITNKKYFIIDKQKQAQPNKKEGSVFYQDGKLWTIKGGIQVQHVMSNRDNCPQCNKWCHRKMDLKYLRAQNMCEDCFLKKDTQMRIDGTWDDYITKIQLEHAIGHLEQEKQELLETKKQTQQGFLKYVQNQTGVIQKWELPKQHILNKINQKLQFIDEHLQQYNLQRDKIIERMEARKNG